MTAKTTPSSPHQQREDVNPMTSTPLDRSRASKTLSLCRHHPLRRSETFIRGWVGLNEEKEDKTQSSAFKMQFINIKIGVLQNSDASGAAGSYFLNSRKLAILDFLWLYQNFNKVGEY